MTHQPIHLLGVNQIAEHDQGHAHLVVAIPRVWIFPDLPDAIDHFLIRPDRPTVAMSPEGVCAGLPTGAATRRLVIELVPGH